MKHMILLALGLLLASCGSMNVQVGVLQPQVVEEEADRLLLRDTRPIVMAQSPDAIADEYNQLKNRRFQVLSGLAKAYAAAGHKKEADDLLNRHAKEVMKPYTEEAQQIVALTKRIQALDADPKQQASLIRQRVTRQRNFLVLADRGMKNDVKAANAANLIIPESIAAVAAEHQAAVQQLMVGESNLTFNRVAYVVTNADDNLWAQIFDRSYGAGRLGKMDFAVKMESRGVFTIKGMTFDPSTVARVAAKVTSQAVIIASQLAGVPVKSGTTAFSGDAAALATSSGQLNAAEEASATAEAKIADKKDALIELAQQILAQRENFENATTDAQIQNAVTAIAAKFNATKTRLNAQ